MNKVGVWVGLWQPSSVSFVQEARGTSLTRVASWTMSEVVRASRAMAVAPSLLVWRCKWLWWWWWTMMAVLVVYSITQCCSGASGSGVGVRVSLEAKIMRCTRAR